MHSIMLATMIVKFAVSILMIIIGWRNISLSYKGSKVATGVVMVMCGVLGYVTSFF